MRPPAYGLRLVRLEGISGRASCRRGSLAQPSCRGACLWLEELQPARVCLALSPVIQRLELWSVEGRWALGEVEQPASPLPSENRKAESFLRCRV